MLADTNALYISVAKIVNLQVLKKNMLQKNQQLKIAYLARLLSQQKSSIFSSI
jgi:hypothetical protein